MKRIFVKSIVLFLLLFLGYFVFIFIVPYSEGYRSGELIKFSRKGMVFKTWEGELSQGISGAQIFSFSVSPKKEEVLQKLEDLQGRYVKLQYIERYKAFPWWGDSAYFIIDVEEESSPFLKPKQQVD
ncbi:MAG: 6-phosphogluconate dehydrogenase [Flavobacteriales bacterium]|nr:6-phosphogluconate dehydrogenase [Flavobacteriales bacterium]